MRPCDDAPVNGADPRFAAGAWYLSQGFRAFTLWGTDERGACRCPRGAKCDQKPGKHPVTDNLAGRHGFKDATDDPARLETLLSAGSRPNLGVLAPEGCFGWDLDGDDAERIGELEASLGPLPPTMGHETPNGRHSVYRWPADVPRPSGHLLGVITRWRDNGYLVGASSRIGTKVYRLRRDEAGEPLPIVDFPRPWVDAAIEYRPAARPPASETATGKRHPDLIATARHLAGRGVRGEALVAALLAVNAEYPGGAKPEAEVREMVAWADANVRDDPDLITITGRVAAGAEAGTSTFPQPEDRGSAVLSGLGGVEYVEDLIRPGRVTLIGAEEGSGKSYAITGELAIRVATAGGAFAGTWAIAKPGSTEALRLTA